MSGESRYSVGDTVRIKTGAFQSFTGRVEEVDPSRAMLRVSVSIFGERQPLELTFRDVERQGFQKENNSEDERGRMN